MPLTTPLAQALEVRADAARAIAQELLRSGQRDEITAIAFIRADLLLIGAHICEAIDKP